MENIYKILNKNLVLLLGFFIIYMSSCSSNKFHNSNYTRKRVNGIYKYYSRYTK